MGLINGALSLTQSEGIVANNTKPKGKTYYRRAIGVCVSQKKKAEQHHYFTIMVSVGLPLFVAPLTPKVIVR